MESRPKLRVTRAGTHWHFRRMMTSKTFTAVGILSYTPRTRVHSSLTKPKNKRD